MCSQEQVRRYKVYSGDKMFSSIFAPKKKKEDQYSKAPNMSYVSDYAQSKPKTVTNNSLFANPVAQFGKSVVAGNGLSAVQSAVNQPTANFSKASSSQTQNSSPVPKLIQASGYGSQYANDLSKQSIPKYVAPTAPKKEDSNIGTDWMNYLTNAAGKQTSLAEQQRDAGMGFLREQGNLNNEYLRGQLPAAQENFNRFKSNTEATIADLIAGGEMQKSQAEDYYGDAQRQSAQTLRGTQAQQQRTFANLGTLDSFGEGSFAEANTNVMSDFNRSTQQLLKAKADNLTQIDMSVRNAERSARQTIAEEEAKMNQVARDIEYAIANNDLQTAQGLKEVYFNSQQRIYDIQDALTQTQYAFAQEQQNLQNELAKIQSFTPEFMQTGNPTNQAEYEFFIKNQEAINNAYGNGDKQAQSDAQYTSDLIDRVITGNTKNITGAMAFSGGLDPWSRMDANAQKSLINQISGQLQLASAGKLKGQGTITDNERAILKDSLLALSQRDNGTYSISDDELRRRLIEAQNILRKNSNLPPIVREDVNTIAKKHGG